MPSCSCGTTTICWATSGSPPGAAAFGLALGAGIGLLLGVVVGLTRLGEELFDASMQMLRIVPYPAVIFLFIIWFGIGETAKVLLIGLATLFPMYLNTSNGVRNVDRTVVEAARSFGVQGWVLVRRVVVPLALPSIMTGLRYSAGISVIALVFTESIGANQGIGYLVSQADSLQQIPVLVVCVVIYAFLGIGADLLVRLLERVEHAVETAPGGPMNPSTPSRPDLAAVVHAVTKSFGDRARPGRSRRHRGPGRVRGPAGRIGQRQDHAAAHSGRPRCGRSRRRVRARRAHRRLPRAPSRGLPAGLAQRGPRSPTCPGHPGARRVRPRKRWGSADHADAWPGTLSGGEAQRVALARALVREPQLLLLDEPFAALDALTRLRMQELVADLCARHRPGVLLVTHDVEEAVLLADRVLVLTEGRISLDQPVDLARPRRVGGEEFDALRDRLLAELGVLEPGRP